MAGLPFSPETIWAVGRIRAWLSSRRGVCKAAGHRSGVHSQWGGSPATPRLHQPDRVLPELLIELAIPRPRYRRLLIGDVSTVRGETQSHGVWSTTEVVVAGPADRAAPQERRSGRVETRPRPRVVAGFGAERPTPAWLPSLKLTPSRAGVGGGAATRFGVIVNPRRRCARAWSAATDRRQAPASDRTDGRRSPRWPHSGEDGNRARCHG
jgi:hypothetical protein